MKYSIKKDEQGNPFLWEDGYTAAVGEPNEPELEFWMRIQELELTIQTFLTKTGLGKDKSTWTTEDWYHRQAIKLSEILNK